MEGFPRLTVVDSEVGGKKSQGIDQGSDKKGVSIMGGE